MLLSDVAELYDLLVEYKGCTADYMVSLTKGNWTIAEGGYGRMWELYYEAEKTPGCCGLRYPPGLLAAGQSRAAAPVEKGRPLARPAMGSPAGSCLP